MSFQWTPTLDQILRDGYVNSRKKSDLTRCISKVVELTGLSRFMVKDRARELGLSHDPRKAWTKAEIDYLEASAGSVSAFRMSKHLGRSYRSVVGRLTKLELRWSVTDGYANRDLAELLRVSEDTVCKWHRNGLIKRNAENRFPESTIVRFLKENPQEYDLRRVDQVWFKSLLFPNAKCYMAPSRVSEFVLNQRIAELESRA